MTEATGYLLGGMSVGTAIALFFAYIRFKKSVKEEIVDPDIKLLKAEIEEVKKTMMEKIARLEENNIRSAANLDKKFDELNHKLDATSQKVSQMQGMLTALFNGMKQNYEQ